MTSKERVRVALCHEEPDRVPMQCDYTPEVEKQLREYLHTGGASQSFRSSLHSTDCGLTLGNDMVITLHGIARGFYASDAEEYVDEWGITWRRIKYEGGTYTEMAARPLQDDARLADFETPNPASSWRYDEVRDMLARYGATHWIVGSVPCTVFEAAWYLRGMDTLLTDMLARKELAHYIMDKTASYSLAVSRILVGLGVDMIWAGDDVATQRGMMFSLPLWREFIKPRYAVMFSELKRINPDLKIAYHSDGNCEAIVPDLIEIGLDVLNPVQPECMDPAEMKRKYGRKLSFFGTVSVQRGMPYGSPADVEVEVRERIRTVGSSGGLIIAPSHNVQPDTPIENVLAFYEAVRRFGNYPLVSRF